MWEHRFRHLPVSEERSHLKGILLDEGLLQHALDITGKVATRSKLAKQKAVSQIMTQAFLAAHLAIEI